jgi:hypothetical protein
MGRLTAEDLREASRAGPESLVARRARVTLWSRGVRVSLAHLGARSVAECIDAVGWAHNRRPFTVCPSWIVQLIVSSKARLRRGICAHCGCNDDRACRALCFWVDRAHTLCSRCVGKPSLRRCLSP